MADTAIETEMVTIPRKEYERLLELAEDASDLAAVAEFDRKLAAGEEELLPSDLVHRFINSDEHPLKIWREYRGLSQSELGRRSGVNRVVIADIEARRKRGSVDAFKKLAAALKLTIDDLVV